VGIDTDLAKLFDTRDCVIHRHISNFLESIVSDTAEKPLKQFTQYPGQQFGLNRQHLSGIFDIPEGSLSFTEDQGSGHGKCFY